MRFAEVEPFLHTRWVGKNFFHWECLDSTNTQAKFLVQTTGCHGDVVVCEQQTQGRGRRGRSWLSMPEGGGLFFSVLLRPELPPHCAPELTLVTAVALAKAIRGLGIEVWIKWPNDIQVGGKKLVGILTELIADGKKTQGVVVGIGMNLNGREEDFPEELRGRATSLAVVSGKPHSKAFVLAMLLQHLEHWFDLYMREGFIPIAAEWTVLSSTLGRRVRVDLGNEVKEGEALHIHSSGALVLRGDDGELFSVLAGDVEHLRPA
ncbi:MAG: biotin--[acetyl-CoA-carboxylase] ligase [Proteobacteria bacterium]|nr:biotin--[acetyl-CoA-carboxylase] ligase [Cystobacterineae bacterium]MCL2315316.1 biotin--[acetyl-CoA-carboxylase] ligase [Pseudomonadota bacterium]